MSFRSFDNVFKQLCVTNFIQEYRILIYIVGQRLNGSEGSAMVNDSVVDFVQ